MSSTSGNLVIFGVSNVLSDFFDIAHALELKVSKIVLNQPEVVRERTKTLNERIQLLPVAPIVQRLEDFAPTPGESYAVAVTSPAKSVLIQKLENEYQMGFRSLIHPTAYVSPYAELGEGVFVGANSVVAPGAVIGKQVFINRGVTIGHDTRVEEFARLFGGCNVGGHGVIGRGATIGLGAAIVEERIIGEGAFVAAGAVVVGDVEAGTLVAGVPAVFKKRI